MIVGFVGLGAMGLPMAQNLIANGHAVQGFDLRPEPGQAFAAAGGKAVASAAEAAEAAAGADVLMLMVVNAAQAEQVLFDAGALQALPEGGTVVLTVTCLPKEAEAIAARVTAAGRRFVDAPVSGGTAGAKAGSLSIMAGCPTALFNELKPLFESFGGKLFHIGETAGQGQMVKTVNQLLCGAHHRCRRRGPVAGRKDGRRSEGRAGDHRGFRSGQLDAERPEPAHAGSRSRSDQRHRHLRQGSGHRPGRRSGLSGRPAAGRCGASALRRDVGAGRRPDRRQSGHPQLRPAQRIGGEGLTPAPSPRA